MDIISIYDKIIKNIISYNYNKEYYLDIKISI